MDNFAKFLGYCSLFLVLCFSTTTKLCYIQAHNF